MNVKVFALVLVLVAGLCALTYGQEREWVEVAPAGGRCVVRMPAKPDEKTESADGEHGKYTTHLFLSRGDSAGFILAWVDHSPDFHADAQAELNANRDSLLESVSAKVTSERRISLDGHPGIEFNAEGANSKYRSRVYMVGDRPYQLLAMWSKGSEEPRGVTAFLSSFRLGRPESSHAATRRSTGPTNHRSAASTGDDISGSYTARGKLTTGSAYETFVGIAKKGGAYTVGWANLKGFGYSGIGVRQGDYLAVTYMVSQNNAAVVLYHVMSKSTLVGTWTTHEAGGAVGTETLTRNQK
jgi:hypothetical protein